MVIFDRGVGVGEVAEPPLLLFLIPSLPLLNIVPVHAQKKLTGYLRYIYGGSS